MEVFLGETCNESTWRKLIPQLKIDYFNPVAEDCISKEIKKRETTQDGSRMETVQSIRRVNFEGIL